jgi:hypothetical protein
MVIVLMVIGGYYISGYWWLGIKNILKGKVVVRHIEYYKGEGGGFLQV